MAMKIEPCSAIWTSWFWPTDNATDAFELEAPKVTASRSPVLEDYAIAAQLGAKLKDIEPKDLAGLSKDYGDYVQKLTERSVVDDDILDKRDAISRRIDEVTGELCTKPRVLAKDATMYFTELNKSRIKTLGILRAIELNDLDGLKERLKNVQASSGTKAQYVLYSFSSEILRDLLAMGLVQEVSEDTRHSYRDVDSHDNTHFYVPEQKYLPLLFALKTALRDFCQFNGSRQWILKSLIGSMSQFERRVLMHNGLAECLTTVQFNELKSIGDEIQHLFSVTSALSSQIEGMAVEDCSNRTLLITQMIALTRLEEQMETLQLRRRHRKQFTRIDDGLYFRVTDAGLDELIGAISDEASVVTAMDKEYKGPDLDWLD